jgi:hypothetical protein
MLHSFPSLFRSSQAEENAPDASNQTQKDDPSLDWYQSEVDDRSQRPDFVASKDDGEKILYEVFVIVNGQRE